MKYLGIDFGSKRVGVAVSDETGQMAFPYAVFPNDRNLLGEIEKLTKAEEIGKVVLGESKNFKGEPNPIMAEIEEFEKGLATDLKLQVYFEPEFMTSAEAEHLQGKNEMHDASAAALILQSFLNRQK